MKERATMRAMKMWPTVIELHDEVYEHENRRVRVVARVYTDGASGELEVLVPEFRRSLTALFTRQRARVSEATTSANGVHSIATDRLFLPWRRETIAHLIDHQLKEKSLKAVFLRGRA